MRTAGSARGIGWDRNFTVRTVAVLLLMMALQGCTPGGGQTNDNDNASANDNGSSEDEITSDTTLASLDIEAGRTVSVLNNAVVTVTGDATIDGEITAPSGRLTLKVDGDLTINGIVSSAVAGDGEAADDVPLGEQEVGVFIVVGDGEVNVGEDAILSSQGSTVITDDESVLDQTPAELETEMLSTEGDELPTLMPLPEESVPVSEMSVRGGKPYTHQDGAELPPVVIGGTWPPAGVTPAGDRPIVIFRFLGNRALDISGWTYNGPPAPAAQATDESGTSGNNAAGRDGKKGGNLYIRNEGGEVRLTGAVTLTLSDGGRGGDATAFCASATGGNGGAAGNLRITGAGGIDISGGSLVIVPGKGGDGGDATVEADSGGGISCPGLDGEDTTATGGPGARNVKALFARGSVTGLENVSIDFVVGGNGGNATADGCLPEDGNECCDGGNGGSATATGGAGGDASVSVSGLAATAAGAVGGDGGEATALGGDGAFGGDCKFFDAGWGGDAGDSTAVGGAGGAALNGGGGATQGGNGGAATANSGWGGDGGDSGLGDPGIGGFEGTSSATGGAAGAGATPGSSGEETEEDGVEGDDGEEMDVFIFCFPFLFVSATDGVIAPGVQEGTLVDGDTEEELGTMSMEFRDIDGAQYFLGSNPVHIGIHSGEVDFLASTINLNEGRPQQIGGLRIASLYGEGITEENPLLVQAINENGEVIDTIEFGSIPDNQGDPDNAETFDALFQTFEVVVTFRVIVPDGAFVTIIEICIIDP